jgi:hypothetical protein
VTKLPNFIVKLSRSAVLPRSEPAEWGRQAHREDTVVVCSFVDVDVDLTIEASPRCCKRARPCLPLNTSSGGMSTCGTLRVARASLSRET